MNNNDPRRDSSKRIQGFDVARALAIFGMVIVNFKIAQQADTGAEFFLNLAGVFEGRASALFVILAGVGVSLLSRSALQSNKASQITNIRKSLIKRGVLLIGLGLGFSSIWPADILHFYGFYFLLASMFITASNRNLLELCVGIIIAFPLLVVLMDYNTGWDWLRLTYDDFWTPRGMLRHIFFNGFHPVFPWAAFFIFGIFLGRLDLKNSATRKRILMLATLIWLSTELVFNRLRSLLFNPQTIGLDRFSVDFYLSTEIIPPMPQYIIAAGSVAVMVIIVCLHFSEVFSANILNKWLNKTGQLALTHYVFHVLLGMGVMEATGVLAKQSIEFSLLCSLIFCGFAMFFSVCWLKYFRYGPMEWLFRRLLGA